MFKSESDVKYLTQYKESLSEFEKKQQDSVSKMQINVKTLTGREIPVDVEPTDQILRIKELMEEKEGIPPAQQRLIFSGKQMDDTQTVAFYKIEPGAQLHLVLTLRGGSL